MMNSLSVSLIVCLFGIASSELTTSTVSILTACKLNKVATYVQLKCDVGEDVGDSTAVIKRRKAATGDSPNLNDIPADLLLLKYPSGNSMTVVVARTEAEDKDFTCQVQPKDASKTTKKSTRLTIKADGAKNLELCSAAPRIVNSIAVALLCLMASFIKSSY